MKEKIFGSLTGVWAFRILILLLICVFMGLSEPRFLTIGNVVNIISYISVYGIMACGMLFAVLIGGLDLSIGRVAALSGTIACLVAKIGGFSTASCLLGIACAIAAGILIGYFHGVLIIKLSIPSFVVTLATSYVIYGAITLLSGESRVDFVRGSLMDTISNARIVEFTLSSGKPFVIQMNVVIFIMFALICWYVLSKTTFGRRIYAIGGNITAAQFVGINVFRNACAAYAISSGAACVGGLILMSSTSYASQTLGAGYEGMVLMALIVGGINLAGGKGTISGAVFGALLVGIIANICTLVDFLNLEYLKFFQGFIILIVCVISVILETRSRRGKGRRAKQIAEMQAQEE
jgi:ribose/xylose/arabinose/galactoside ABC-type transport system permease subunit